MGVVISFINLKGGVGKTTCCANIAGELARENRKVLVIDADPQANISTLLMSVTRYENKFDSNLTTEDAYKDTIYQIFLDAMEESEINKKFKFEEAIVKSVVRKDVQGRETQPLTHLDLLPATHHLMELEQKIVNYVRSRFAILERSIKQIKEIYDFVLIDCPPNIYTTTHNSLYASDYYIIPTIPDYLSTSGFPLLINSLNKTIDIKKEEKNVSVKLAGILVNLRDKRINVHKDGLIRIQRYLDYFKNENLVDKEAILFNTKITNKVDIKNATGKYLPVCIDKPRSESTMEFKTLCSEILSQINK
ncbi:MAG: ParA family protein [Promethearchaeota archaeon]